MIFPEWACAAGVKAYDNSDQQCGVTPEMMRWEDVPTGVGGLALLQSRRYRHLASVALVAFVDPGAFSRVIAVRLGF